MISYTIRRVLQLIPVLFFISLLLFLLLNILPGDPTFAILGQEASDAQRTATRQQLGLDRPLIAQYWTWLTGALSGDLGRSYVSNEPIASILSNRLPATAELGVISLILAIIVGIPAGILASARKDKATDHTLNGFSLVALAMPHFYLATLLILLLSVTFRLFPAAGYVAFTEDPGQSLKYMVLPALTVFPSMAAVFMRQTRASLLTALSEDHIRTATATGLPRRQIVLKYALRNAAIPVATVAGLQFGALVSAMVLTETIFTLPGLGSTIVNAILNRDIPVVQGGVLVIVVFVLLVNLITDLVYGWLDPRISLA